jgi:hypothetical protein
MTARHVENKVKITGLSNLNPKDEFVYLKTEAIFDIV